MEAFANSKLDKFDEDIFHDTYLKVREKLEKDGIEDTSELGLLNYFFKAFKQNTLREKDYARNKKEDLNYDQDSIPTAYENWCEKQNISAKEKLIHDLYEDFAVLYILTKVEEVFDAETFFAFRLKTLMGYTYKQLADKTNIPSVRNKVIEVFQWLRENVTKDEVKKAFNENFSDLIDF